MSLRRKVQVGQRRLIFTIENLVKSEDIIALGSMMRDLTGLIIIMLGNLESIAPFENGPFLVEDGRDDDQCGFDRFEKHISDFFGRAIVPSFHGHTLYQFGNVLWHILN